jgi:hypothetical protein
MLAFIAGFFTGAVTAVAGIILAGRAFRQGRLQPAQVQYTLTVSGDLKLLSNGQGEIVG